VTSPPLFCTPPKQANLLCPICDRPILLETATTNENGHIFHEYCYGLKVDLKRASGS